MSKQASKRKADESPRGARSGSAICEIGVAPEGSLDDPPPAVLPGHRCVVDYLSKTEGVLEDELR
jgi:hypothetical protein